MKSKLDLGLRPVDDLFETDESREDRKRERIMELSISEISDFPDHPYKVKDDESMMELADSIKSRGLLQPVLVRPKEDGGYEMVAGHRRKRACEIAGIATIKCRVQELTRDEAVLSMVDSNLQREVILPSEKAKAYKMRLDAMRRQAGRPSKDNSVPLAQNYEGKTSRELLGEQVGESQDNVRRFIRLNELIPPLLDMVDDKNIALRPAVEISYLLKEEQEMLRATMEYCDATPSHAQTIKLRKYSQDGKLTEAVVQSIMEEEKPNQRPSSEFKDERIRKLIPKTIPKEREADYVVQALEYYNRHRERQQMNSR